MPARKKGTKQEAKDTEAPTESPSVRIERALKYADRAAFYLARIDIVSERVPSKDSAAFVAKVFPKLDSIVAGIPELKEHIESNFAPAKERPDFFKVAETKPSTP